MSQHEGVPSSWLHCETDGLARDFVGYGNYRLRSSLDWPIENGVAVTFVINFEEGAELNFLLDGDCKGETVMVERPQRVFGHRNYCAESHFEFGTRVGYWRVIEAFERYGYKATFSCCGRAVDFSQWLVQDAYQRGHEIAAHGYKWVAHDTMSLEEETKAIDAAVESIKVAIGKPPLGWHTKSRRSPHTCRLLHERGFLYSDDAYNDDTPYFIYVDEEKTSTHLILPYHFDTNDMHFQDTDRFFTGDSFAKYVCDSFDWLCRRESTLPRMMTIALHLRVIGRPGRMCGLDTILKHLHASGKAWVVPRETIAKYWIEKTSQP